MEEAKQSAAEEQRHADPFLEERIRGYRTAQPSYPDPQQLPLYPVPKKSKFLTGLFSCFVPGTGHFYLGLMPKGLFMMLLFFVNIAAIPYFVINTEGSGENAIPLVVLISCLLPITYFYNIFDALQSADAVNASYVHAQRSGEPWQMPGRTITGNHFGLFLVGVGLVIFLFTSKPIWIVQLFTHGGAYAGAFILIAAGLVMFWLDRRK